MKEGVAELFVLFSFFVLCIILNFNLSSKFFTALLFWAATLSIYLSEINKKIKCKILRLLFIFLFVSSVVLLIYNKLI